MFICDQLLVTLILTVSDYYVLIVHYYCILHVMLSLASVKQTNLCVSQHESVGNALAHFYIHGKEKAITKHSYKAE